MILESSEQSRTAVDLCDISQGRKLGKEQDWGRASSTFSLERQEEQWLEKWEDSGKVEDSQEQNRNAASIRESMVTAKPMNSFN